MKTNKSEIIIESALENKLEREGILLKHIIEVIGNAERNNEKIYLPERGTFISHLRIGNVTFWTEYEKENEDYILKNAYCHRIQIENV